ncbi:hypothetical protein [Rhizobium oryziradicis]|nr:hypothetical protein [Rhizobium oryziradicis]
MHDALLDVAEKLFRHIGHQKTTIEDNSILAWRDYFNVNRATTMFKDRQ